MSFGVNFCCLWEILAISSEQAFLTPYLLSFSHLERLVNPLDNVWKVKETFKLPADHIEFARLVFRSPAICPPTYSTSHAPLTARPHRDALYSDDEFSARSRSTSTTTGSQSRRGVSPRPSSALGNPGSPIRSRRSDVDGHLRNRAESVIASDIDPLSSDENFGNHSPPLSPRRSRQESSSPHQSPRRPRRMSIGGGSSNAVVSSPSTSNPLSNSQTLVGPSVPSSTMSSSSSIPTITPARVDSTVLWADFLESTHLVANCPLFKPKDPLDTTQLAALHFYVFSLQSPPSESSSRREKAKSHGTSGRDGTPDRNGKEGSGPLTVHIEESPTLSKLYRKSLHKNVGAFYPMRLTTSSSKGSVLEDAIWSSYTDYTLRKLTVEDAMQEYTRIFNQWKFSGVRLFFDVKRDFSAILSPKSSVLAINEDGLVIMKNHKENDIVASYPYTNISHWTVVGNMLSLELLSEETSASVSSASLEPSTPTSTSSIGLSPSGNTNSSLNPNSAKTLLQPSYLGPTTSVLISSNQIETISAIMQFYLDRLTQLVFERSESLRMEPSPRPFLVTDVAHYEPAPSSSGHKINVDSLGPALRQLRDERGDISGPASSTSDSDRENAGSAANMFLLSPSSDSLYARKGSSPTAPTGSSSSPVLGRRRSPSLSRRNDDQRIDQLRTSDHLEEGFTSQDGPRRQSTKSKRAPGSGSFRGMNSSRQSDTESRGSESDRERLVSSQCLTIDGSESDFGHSARADSPSPFHLTSSTSSVDQSSSAFHHDTSASEGHN